MTTHQARRVTTRGIIYKDGKVFAQRLKKPITERDGVYWCTPGGGIDFGESLHENLHREMIEETGIAPEIGKLLFVQQFHDGFVEQLEFFFEITNSDAYETIDLATTSHGDIEVEVCGFVNPKVENVLPAFLQEIEIGEYIGGQLPPLVRSYL